MAKYGDPFYVAVTEGNLSGEITSCDVMKAELDHESAVIAGMVDDCREHGGAEQLYICIPIGRVWAADYSNDGDSEGPYEDVRTDVAETQIERMARAAIALGGTK
jgi:hypothetical protein